MSGKIPISIKLFINPQICSVIIVEHFLITIIGMLLVLPFSSSLTIYDISYAVQELKNILLHKDLSKYFL